MWCRYGLSINSTLYYSQIEVIVLPGNLYDGVVCRIFFPSLPSYSLIYFFEFLLLKRRQRL